MKYLMVLFNRINNYVAYRNRLRMYRREAKCMFKELLEQRNELGRLNIRLCRKYDENFNNVDIRINIAKVIKLNTEVMDILGRKLSEVNHFNYKLRHKVSVSDYEFKSLVDTDIISAKKIQLDNIIKSL